MTIIKLQPWEYAHANEVGIGRFVANWEKRDAQYYVKEFMEDDRTAQVAAAVCELAVAKALNRYWHAHVWHISEHKRYSNIPDVGKNIEVRRVRTGNGVAVREHQVGKGLFIYAAKVTMPELMQVEILGWLPHDEAWDLGKPAHYDKTKTTRTVDCSLLHEFVPNDKMFI